MQCSVAKLPITYHDVGNLAENTPICVHIMRLCLGITAGASSFRPVALFMRAYDISCYPTSFDNYRILCAGSHNLLTHEHHYLCNIYGSGLCALVFVLYASSSSCVHCINYQVYGVNICCAPIIEQWSVSELGMHSRLAAKINKSRSRKNKSWTKPAGRLFRPKIH